MRFEDQMTKALNNLLIHLLIELITKSAFILEILENHNLTIYLFSKLRHIEFRDSGGM